MPAATTPLGRDSESTPIFVSQVERSPSARRTSPEATVTSPLLPVRTNARAWPPPTGFRPVTAGIASSLLAVAAGTGTGPHVWYGAYVSYGSLTATRYGIGFADEKTSVTAAVRPPELEKKNVCATLPSKRSTWRFVPSTAWSPVGVSAEIPPYTWSRVSL